MTAKKNTDWHIHAAIASWLVPGLGHLLLGHVRRGVILMIGIYGLFIAGLLIGGIDVVSSRQTISIGGQKATTRILWYYAQVLVGPPAILIDQYKQAHEPPGPPTPARPHVAFIRSVGRPHELGTLYCAMAGVLNLLVIIDALQRPAAARSAEPADAPDDAPDDAPAGQLVRRKET